MLVGFVGEERKIAIVILRVSAPVAAADFVAHAPEFFGLGDRQRLEHHLMNEGENRGRGANTQGECDHRSRGESVCFSESPKRFLQIRHVVSLDCVWCRYRSPALSGSRLEYGSTGVWLANRSRHFSVAILNRAGLVTSRPQFCD